MKELNFLKKAKREFSLLKQRLGYLPILDDNWIKFVYPSFILLTIVAICIAISRGMYANSLPALVMLVYYTWKVSKAILEEQEFVERRIFEMRYLGIEKLIQEDEASEWGKNYYEKHNHLVGETACPQVERYIMSWECLKPDWVTDYLAKR